MIITDEDKFELNNVELFSIEHYKEAKRKFLTIVLSSQGDWRKAINKKVLVIDEIK